MKFAMFLVGVAGAALATTDATGSPTLLVVDLQPKQFSGLATQIAVQTCAGLFNRDTRSATAAYVLFEARDSEWLADVAEVRPLPISVDDFLKRCLHGSEGGGAAPVAKGRIRYNATAQQLLTPNILTMAAVLDGVPLEDEVVAGVGVPVVFDATVEFAGFGALEATEYVFTRHAASTSTMAKMNPGLDVHHHPFNPPLTGKPDLKLADYVVKARLFTFFLNDGCIPLTAEHALMERMTTTGPWPQPIVVYGYDDTWPLAGDLFEAETGCVRRHNMGQVASSGVSNLGYFSRWPPITSPLVQPPPSPPTSTSYSSSRTYLTIIVGDGDNIAFVKGSRREWIEDRLKRCAGEGHRRRANDRGCFPLVWTLSPALLHAAPSLAVWFFNKTHQTGRDHIVLPPSGHTYAYPGSMQGGDQATFVAQTEADAHLYNTSGSVAWEFTGSWPHAISTYFPRYAANGRVRGLFPVNVPFMLPVLAFRPTEDYKLLGGGGNGPPVLFRPREWRGAGGGDEQNLNATQLARQINSLPRGTVMSLYVTSDGGANLELIYSMVEKLAAHVEIVSQETLVEMALQRG
jgi:hypothetical protein